MGTLALGAAAFALVTRPAPHTTVPGTGDEVEDTTVKGTATSAPAVGVYRHGATRDERLADGARAARGDLLQLTYRAGADRFGALLSIDGRGHVTLHWPEGTDASARLDAKGEVRVPAAYELDDAPAFERFVLVSADVPFPLATALDAARALATSPRDARARALALPAPLHQASLTLAKETP